MGDPEEPRGVYRRLNIETLTNFGRKKVFSEKIYINYNFLLLQLLFDSATTKIYFHSIASLNRYFRKPIANVM